MFRPLRKRPLWGSLLPWAFFSGVWTGQRRERATSLQTSSIWLGQEWHQVPAELWMVEIAYRTDRSLAPHVTVLLLCSFFFFIVFFRMSWQSMDWSVSQIKETALLECLRIEGLGPMGCQVWTFFFFFPQHLFGKLWWTSDVSVGPASIPLLHIVASCGGHPVPTPSLLIGVRQTPFIGSEEGHKPRADQSLRFIP